MQLVPLHYECLAREFVEPQIKLTSTTSAGASAGASAGRGASSSASRGGGGLGGLAVAGDAVVTIIEMRDAAKVIL
jgi:hypothetical protein